MIRRRLFLALAAALGGLPAARAAEASEAALKAAYLVHFTQFVSWPDPLFATPDAPFVIGIFGGDMIDDNLVEMARGEHVAGHRVEVRRLRSPADADSCHMVYVPNGLESQFRLARTGSVPVLTVGESDRFLEDGGIIEFYSDHAHVRLLINLQAARAVSLVISSKLLRVAQVVSPSSLSP